GVGSPEVKASASTCLRSSTASAYVSRSRSPPPDSTRYIAPCTTTLRQSNRPLDFVDLEGDPRMMAHGRDLRARRRSAVQPIFGEHVRHGFDVDAIVKRESDATN